MASPPKEDEIDRKWDKCAIDGVVKIGGGVVLGSIFSLLFFKNRKWPYILGAGFGMGMAYSNCEQEINQVLGGQAMKKPPKC